MSTLPDSSQDNHLKSDFIREIIHHDVTQGKHQEIITRFPPEPNGYLHLGHAKSICLNFGISLEQKAAGVKARCHLRFDDTNPEKEEVEYVESIQKDVAWLGFDCGEHVYYASSYFEFFYNCAVDLIRKGLAYVDHQSLDEIRATRGNLIEAGKPSPYRDRSVTENMELFGLMRAGKFSEGECVLRAKIDMASSNLNMRDPVIYRIMHREHHHTGDQWCIYPLYDFAHPLEDALEHITHSLCTLEFENHRPLYDWFIEHCPVPSKPRQIEFARLNLTYTIMSKRKLLQLVKEGHVTGWDDPRLPTISGVRRRGYPAEAIRRFCQRIGITKYNGTSDVALLEFEVRDYLNTHAPRRMAVMNPLKLIIENWSEATTDHYELTNHPQNSEMGSRPLAIHGEVWIEQDDFMAVPEKKFHRLSPGNHVRLRGGHIIQCTRFECDAHGMPNLVYARLIPGTIGSNAPEGIVCKAAIHWVDVSTAAEAEVRLYDRLFQVENPDETEGGFLSAINPDSLTLKQIKIEPSLLSAPAGFYCQLERIGYFITDEKDHQPMQCAVLNRTIALKDSWLKMKQV